MSTCEEQTWPVCWFVPSFPEHGGWVTRTRCCLWTFRLCLIPPFVRKSWDVPLRHRRIHSTSCWIWVCPLDAATDLVIELTANPGALLEHCAVPQHIVDMVKSAHNGAWFELRGCVDKLVTVKGGRQGCPLGALFFKPVQLTFPVLSERRLGQSKNHVETENGR